MAQRERSMKVGALFANKTRDGETYLSFALDGPIIIADPKQFGMVAWKFKRADGEPRRENDPMFTVHITEQRGQRQAAGSDFEDDEPAQQPARRDAAPAQQPRQRGYTDADQDVSPRRAPASAPPAANSYDQDGDDPFAE
jgi:hypothetical protein